MAQNSCTESAKLTSNLQVLTRHGLLGPLTKFTTLSTAQQKKDLAFMPQHQIFVSDKKNIKVVVNSTYFLSSGLVEGALHKSAPGGTTRGTFVP